MVVKAIDSMEGKGIKIVIAIARFIMAAQFLWAFFDKLFGLSHTTTPDKAWIRGGAPTAGFLGNAATGPLQTIYNLIAGKALTNWLFMLALVLIGLALLIGAGMKVATISGSVLLFLQWSAILPKPGNILQIDEHVVYILVLLTLLFLKAGQIAGFGRWWADTKLVKKLPGLE